MGKSSIYDPQRDGMVEAIKIYNNGISPIAILTFTYGGSAEIKWDIATEREKYAAGINAYTLIYDERAVEYGRTFESFIKERTK